jgi:hypothetical protein
MGISTGTLPRRYYARLDAAHDRLRLFAANPESISPARVDPLKVVMPHTVWFLHLGHFLARQPWNRAVRRGAWAYYFPLGNGRMACAHLQISPGKPESISFTEGPLVDKLLRLVQRAEKDNRSRRAGLEFRVLIAPAVHFVCVWLKGTRGAEFFIPATPGKGPLGEGKWLTRVELRQGLLARAERHLAAQARRDQLLRERGEKLPMSPAGGPPG